MPDATMTSGAYWLLRVLMENVIVAAIFSLIASYVFVGVSVPFEVSILWLPAGVSCAAVLLFGIRVTPGIIAGEWINITAFYGMPTSISLLVSSITALQSVVIGLMYRRFLYLNGRIPHGRVSRGTRSWLASFYAIAASGALIAPSLGLFLLCQAGVFNWSDYLTLWLPWWFGDLLGISMVVPLAIQAGSYWKGKTFFSSWLTPTAMLLLATGPFVVTLHFLLERGFPVHIPGNLSQEALQSIVTGLVGFALIGSGVLTLPIVAARERERKYLEQFRLFGANTSDAVQIFDHHGIRIYANDRARDLFGPASDASTLPEPAHPSDDCTARKLYEQVKHSLDSGETASFDSELRISQGNTIQLNTLIDPTWEGDNRPTGVISVTRDITQLRLDQDSRVNTAVSRLSGGVSHRYNNLLGIVIGNLDRLERAIPENCETRRFLDAAREAALRAANDNKLLLAASQRNCLAIRCCRLDNIVETVASRIREEVGNDITIRLEREDGPLYADADREALRFTLSQIVENAATAMRSTARDPIITIRTRRSKPGSFPASDANTDAGNRFITVEVSDNGAGMTETSLSRAFDPYFTTSETKSSSGLGLSACRGLVLQMGGTISIDSAVDVGTTVRMQLPSCDPTASV